MKVNTALSFLCLGAGLSLAHNDDRKHTRRILGLLVVVIAGATLVEYAFHISLGIDQLLFRDTRTASLSAYPGRMAIATAICFLLLGLAVAFLGIKKAIVLQRALVGACFVLSLVALCGYLYRVNSLYAISSFSTVAVHTAAGFFAACLAYFLARPDEGIVSIAASDSSSGFLLRTLIPAIIVVPIVIGWVRLAGQRANLYDTPFGVALLVLGNIGCLAVLTILIGRSLNRLEWERSRTDEVHFRHSAIIESTSDAIISADMNGTVSSWNKGAEQLFGYAASEATGRNILFLSPADRPDDGPNILKKVLEGSVLRHYETVRRRKDGTCVDVSLTVSPIVDAEARIVGVSGIARDITEQKRSEDTLRKSEERFCLAAHAGKMFAYEWDVATDLILRSPEAAQILGIDEAAQTTGQQILAQVHPDDREKLTAAVAAISPEKPYLQICYRVARSDGAVIWVSRNSRGHFDEQGKMLRVVGMVTDITDHKLVEEALRNSEERLRLAQWAARIGTFDLSLRTGVDIWTPETEALYGLPPGGFGGTLTAFENLIHPDDRERVIELTHEMMRTGQPAEGEWRVVWPDGSVHWIAGRGQVFMNESGELSRMLGVNIDVTDRKLAEQELAATSERLHLAIDSGSVGGWDFDIKTDRNVWFGKAHAQLGMAHEETLGSRQEFWDRVHEDDREHLRHAIRVAKDKHEEFTEDFRVVWRDGTTHWLRSRGRYHYAANGDPERMLGVSLDITQSKQAEEALRESEQRLRLATQAGRMYAYDWDVTTNVVMRSSEHVKILGLTEPLRFPQQFVDKIHPDDRPKFLATIAGLTPENPTGEVTYRVLASDGTLVWLKSNGRGFFDAEGRLLRVIGMVVDVNDQKQAEETLSGMTRKLVEAQEQERARIARELHDDINQRLALLAIELDQLRNGRNHLPAEVRGHVQELQQMTSDISSSVYALSHELYSSIPDSLGLAKGMKSWCKEFGKRQKMGIDFMSHDLPELPQEVSLCLLRVLQEAMHNAAKHSGAKRIDVQLAENSGEIHLIVSDSGKGFGIEAARQSRGLGLTSMQERVRLVGGTIAIESKPMGGTAIHVRVPIQSKQLSQRATV
jgi:PAS domain S-box-containing protein